MAWNSTVSDIHTFNIEFTLKEIYHRQKAEGDKQVVYNLRYKIVGTDTDGSGNTYTIEDEWLAFNISQVDTNREDFVDINDVTDEVAIGWIQDFYLNNNNLDVAFTNLLYGPPDAVGGD